MSECCEHGYAWDKLCPICSKIIPLKAENAILREALEMIGCPYDHKWYKSAEDGDAVVDRMIEIASEALQLAVGGECVN